MKRKRFTLFAVLVLLAVIFCSITVQAESYTYTNKKKVMELPIPYEVVATVSSSAEFISPVDMRVYDEHIYVLDSARKDITLIDENYNVLNRILFTKDSVVYETNQLSGFYIFKDKFYVADYGKGCIFVADNKGNVLEEIFLGEDVLGTTAFKPQCIIVDHTGFVYIISENEYRGIIVLNENLEFESFYGALNVDVSASLLVDMMWRNFMTDDQIDNSVQYIPGGYTDIDIDENGFIYTTRGVSEKTTELIRKLNPAGSNVLAYTEEFGDMELVKDDPTSFAAISVDSNGFITALDKTRQRLFQYSPEGDLLYIFAGKGQQNGLFINAVCTANLGEELLVLDKDAASLTVLKPTSFGAMVREAVTLYRKAQFTDSEELWKEILKQSGNYEYAYVGLGKIYETNKSYSKAMEYYHLGDSVENYSSAMKKYRSELLKDAFGFIMTGIVIVVIVIFVIMKKRAGIKKQDKPKLYERGKVAYIFYTLMHPSDGYADLRYNGKYSLLSANVIVLWWFLVSCLNFNYNGYIFNENNVNDFNIWVILLSTVGVIFLFTLSSVLLSSFFEGKGKFGEIWIGLSYALIPHVVWLTAELLLTNVLVAEEGAFVIFFRIFFAAWTLFLCFIALIEIHQYSFTMAVASTLCSVIGVLIVVFLVFLMFNLTAQIADFFKTIFNELNYRNLAG